MKRHDHILMTPGMCRLNCMTFERKHTSWCIIFVFCLVHILFTELITQFVLIKSLILLPKYKFTHCKDVVYLNAARPRGDTGSNNPFLMDRYFDRLSESKSGM